MINKLYFQWLKVTYSVYLLTPFIKRKRKQVIIVKCLIYFENSLIPNFTKNLF